MAGGKSNWNDEPIKKNGVLCGRKTFDISDKGERVLCANELLCRQFLKDKKSTFITNLVVIEPESVQTLLDEIDSDKVRCDFWGERDKFEKSLSSISGTVTLFIELGTSDTKALFKDYAMDYPHHKAEILSIIHRLFEMVNMMQKIGFVNTDIKADNLIYSERDNEPSLIMNDFDTSFILNTDKGIRFKAIDKHPFTEPAPELVGWHTENRVGNWTDIFIAGILAYRLLNNFDYPQAFTDAKHGISDITERYFEYQRLFNSLSNGEETIEPPANGSDKLKATILNALRIVPEKRLTPNDILKEISNSIEQTKTVEGNSFAENGALTEIIPTKSVKEKKSALSYALFAVPLVAFIGILSFVLFGQLHKEDHKGGENEPPVIISEKGTSVETSTASSIKAPSLTETTRIPAETTQVSIGETTETEVATTRSAKSDSHKQNTDRTAGEDDESGFVNTTPTPTEAETASPTEPPTEASFLFEYRTADINGNGIFANVSGIEITGYSEDEGIPPCLEIPETIDGIKVVSIADDAFCGSDIEEVVIPDSVVNIGERAFCNCPLLWRITLGKKVAMIGEQAFFNIQYSGSHDEPEMIINNPSHWNCEQFFGDQWDGREHDYLLVFNY